MNIQDVAHMSFSASTLYYFSFIFYKFIFYIYFYPFKDTIYPELSKEMVYTRIIVPVIAGGETGGKGGDHGAAGGKDSYLGVIYSIVLPNTR